MLSIDLDIERYGIIAYITELVNENKVQFNLGKTAFQKIIYILQEIYDLPLGYRFDLYNYGPYCSTLMGDIDFTGHLKGIRVQAENYSGVSGYLIEKGEEYDKVINYSKDFILKNGDEIKQAISDFQSFSTKELEITATIYFIYDDIINNSFNPKPDNVRQELLEKTKKVKPKFSEEVIEEKIKFLESKNFISLN